MAIGCAYDADWAMGAYDCPACTHREYSVREVRKVWWHYIDLEKENDQVQKVRFFLNPLKSATAEFTGVQILPVTGVNGNLNCTIFGN